MGCISRQICSFSLLVRGTCYEEKNRGNSSKGKGRLLENKKSTGLNKKGLLLKVKRGTFCNWKGALVSTFVSNICPFPFDDFPLIFLLLHNISAVWKRAYMRRGRGGLFYKGKWLFIRRKRGTYKKGTKLHGLIKKRPLM